MKKSGKILRISLLVLFLALITGITLTIGWRPFIGPRRRAATDRKFERTPERLARGRYLTLGILGCETCHSPKDWTKHGGPVVPGMEFAGQSLVGLVAGFPGTPTVPNITPDPETGAGNWTDDEISRAIREGIKHDGSTLFPMMPYAEYKNLSDEDVASVVVYLRSLTPIKNAIPPMRVNFPVNYLVRSAPEPVTETIYAPVPTDRLATGKYLVSMGCGCHRTVDAIDFGGGDHLSGPWGEVTSANITADPSGIGYYDEASFVQVIRTGYVGARKLNSIMPFAQFKNLSDDDLKAIFAYLRTVKPVKHRVDNTLPPSYCKICKSKHGAGDQN